MAQALTIDRLLNLVPDSPDLVLGQLQTHRELASQQDAHGYSLVHAAASYGHDRLLTALIQEFHVDPNIKDEDGETALFSVEDVPMARKLIALGTNMHLSNHDGQTAAEKLDDEDEQPTVAAYLKGISTGASASQAEPAAIPNGSTSPTTAITEEPHLNGNTSEVHPPPPLPNGMQLNVGVMSAAEAGDEPDPEFRRRIEELAARSDFETEAGQRELRNLVTDALSGFKDDSSAPPASRRRLD